MKPKLQQILSFESIFNLSIHSTEKSPLLKKRFYLLKDCGDILEKNIYNDEELTKEEEEKLTSLYSPDVVKKAGFWLEGEIERIGYLLFKELNKAQRYFLNLNYPGLDKLVFSQKRVTFNSSDPTAGTDYSLTDKENKRSLIIKERYGCLLISFEDRVIHSKYNSLHYQVNPTDSNTIDKPEDVVKVIAAFFGLEKFSMDIIEELEKLSQENLFEFQDPMGPPSRYE